jgi:hypothetical protein
MRLAPVSIRWFDNPSIVIERAAASSRPTHNARRPVDACRLLAAMTAALVRGESRERVFAPDFWSCGDLHPEVEAVARGSWRGNPFRGTYVQSKLFECWRACLARLDATRLACGCPCSGNFLADIAIGVCDCDSL